MPHQPSLSQVHVNRPLTSFSIAYIQSARNFVANRVAPSIPVQKQSDAYFKHNKGDFFRDEMKKRAPATESAGSGWNISTETYLAEVWALHKDIPDQIRANQDAPLDMERDATIFLTHKALLRKEKIFAHVHDHGRLDRAGLGRHARHQVGPGELDANRAISAPRSPRSRRAPASGRTA